MTKSDRDPLAIRDRLPGHGTFDSGDLADEEVADRTIVHRDCQALHREVPAPDKGAEIEHHPVSSRRGGARQIRGGFPARWSRYARVPARPSRCGGRRRYYPRRENRQTLRELHLRLPADACRRHAHGEAVLDEGLELLLRLPEVEDVETVRAEPGCVELSAVGRLAFPVHRKPHLLVLLFRHLGPIHHHHSRHDVFLRSKLRPGE